jgi:hypothetical protein
MPDLRDWTIDLVESRLTPDLIAPLLMGVAITHAFRHDSIRIKPTDHESCKTSATNSFLIHRVMTAHLTSSNTPC